MAFEGIHIARTGMASSQRALDVIGDNIANVGTPGHTRRRVEQVSIERAGPAMHLGPGAHGGGVRITGVERVRDVVLDATVRAEMSNSAGAELTAQTLAQIEGAIGPMEGGLPDAMTAFWNSWEELSLDPTSMAARTQVLGAADRLVQLFGAAGDSLDAIVGANVATATMALDEYNAALADVARLNGQILAQQSAGENPNALLDQRDRHLDNLAAGLGARVNLLENGMVNVSVNGFEVVRGDVSDRLEIAGSPANLQTSGGQGVVPGGAIGSLLVETRSVADQTLAELDSIALSLHDAVNAAHQAGFDLDGNAAGLVFTATEARDFALDSSLTATSLAASASGEALDGNHALTMGAIRNQTGPDGSIDDRVRNLLGRVGAAIATANLRAELNEGVLDGLRDERSSISGVNIDEELTMLLQFQRAYEASARVLTTVDEMLDVLINRTGIVGR